MHTGSCDSLFLLTPSPLKTVASDYEQPSDRGSRITLQSQKDRLLPAADGLDTASPCQDRKVTPSTSAAIYVNPDQNIFFEGQGESVHPSAGEHAFQAFLQHHGDEVSLSLVEGDPVISSGTDSTRVLSAEQFKEMLLSGKAFSSDVCYVVKGDIDLSGDTRFKTLPDNLIVLGELNLEDCYGLRDFPQNLFVQGDCTITHCFSLGTLGKTLIVLKDFEACECTELTEQTGIMLVHGDINMAGCSGLKAWTGKTQCKGSVYLAGCTRLKRLEQIEVEDDLDLSSCYQFRGLPECAEDFKVGGNIVLSGCKRLSPLPEHIMTQRDGEDNRIRYITLENWDSIQRLDEKSRLRNKNIIFDCQPLDNAPDDIFDDFTEAFGFWSKIAKSGQIAPDTGHLKEFERGILIEFLEHLTRTAEYQNSSRSDLLAQRVLNIFPLISDVSDTETRQRALDIMYYAVTSCGDRVILAMHDLEALTQLVQSEKRAQECNDPEELKSIARQMVYLAKIREYACKLANEKDLDDVEVELSLHLAFQKAFKLPGLTKEIESAYCFELDESRRKEIQESIENECTEKVLEEYLQNWPAWQQFERRQNIPAFDQLPVVHVERIRRCALTEEEISETTEMVLLPEPEGVQVTYKNLCKAYILYGNNPYAQTALDWSKVKRIYSGSGIAKSFSP